MLASTEERDVDIILLVRLFTFKDLFPFDFSLRASSSGALAAGREKEGELATRSLETEYLHRKSRCEMLIVGDDISNDVSSNFQVFFNLCLLSRSSQLRADWRKSHSAADGEPQEEVEFGGGIRIPER